MGDSGRKRKKVVTDLRQVEVLCGQAVPRIDAIRLEQITEQTLYRWRKQFGGMGADQLQKLKRFQKEDDRLHRAVSDWALDQLVLSEAAWRILMTGRLCVAMPSGI